MEIVKLTRTGSKPLYIQIRDYYKDLILSGSLEYGQKIDSEMEIQKLFGVSRITARQAIIDLEKEGLVSRGRGKGTFVSYQRPQANSLTMSSFTEYIRSRGKTPGTSRFDISKIQADKNLEEIFHMVNCKPLYCFKRIRTVDNVRICYMINFFPCDLSLPWNVESYDESVYQKLIEATGASPYQASEEFTAMIPTQEICHELNISQECPVLCKKRRSYDEKGRVIEYSISYYRGDMYVHEMDLHATSPQDTDENNDVAK